MLWQADPQYWGKSSPVLFPIVGMLKDGKYIHQGKEYQLSRHGFARDYDFKLEEVTESQLIFSLEATAETLAAYPFLFKLKIIYTLTVNSLEVTYKVENLSNNETMYFSLGAHPAFNVGNTSKDFYNYKLLFNNYSELRVNYLKNGLLTEDRHTILLNDQKLPLDYKLFANDALVMLDIKSNQMNLLDKDDNNILRFKFENFPYFGLWTVKDAGFICLEPWAGVADFETHNYKFKNKEGIKTLKPIELWTASWTAAII